MIKLAQRRAAKDLSVKKPSKLSGGFALLKRYLKSSLYNICIYNISKYIKEENAQFSMSILFVLKETLSGILMRATNDTVS